MLAIRKATAKDADFIAACVQHLLAEKKFTGESYRVYFEKLLDQQYGSVDVWLAMAGETAVGYITAVKFPIPRYLGFGVELEEVVVLPEFQRRGYGRQFILLLKDQYTADKDCRKICVKTDDHQGSGRLYGDLMNRTDMCFYQQFLNKL